MSKIARSGAVMIARTAFGALLIAMIGWGALAIYYSYLPEAVRTVLSILYALGAVAILIFFRPRRFAYGAFFVLFAIVLF